MTFLPFQFQILSLITLPLNELMVNFRPPQQPYPTTKLSSLAQSVKKTIPLWIMKKRWHPPLKNYSDGIVNSVVYKSNAPWREHLIKQMSGYKAFPDQCAAEAPFRSDATTLSGCLRANMTVFDPQFDSSSCPFSTTINCLERNRRSFSTSAFDWNIHKIFWSIVKIGMD